MKRFEATMGLKIANSKLPASAGEVVEIEVSDGRLVSLNESTVDAERSIDGGGCIVLPGFIDVHNHGAVGVDVNGASAESLLRVAEFLARNGVTAWLPTLVPDSDENYLRVIGEIDRLMEMQTGRPVAQALGVHYEGVFASKAMCGALRPQYFKTGKQLAGGGWQLPRLKSGVHMTTLAPEVEGGTDLINALVADGWVVSIGHSGADREMLDAAFAAGARHLTHFFNAMTGIHHRHVGVAGWGMTRADVTFDIIADGIHVAPEILQFACRMKGANKVTLISDSVAPTGMGDGSYELWDETISVVNGRTQNERGSIAGSVITMLDAVRIMRSLGFSVADVARMSAENPARLLGVSKERGSINSGKRADLVALNDDGSVKFVMIGGELVEIKESTRPEGIQPIQSL